jgi:hypothetical protein
MITKTERTELRSVVRQQVKVLRSEVRQREVEVVADIDRGIADQFAESDAKADGIYKTMREIVREANRAIGEMLAEADSSRWREYEFLQVPHLPRTDHRHRVALRQAAVSDLNSKVQTAILRLDRIEADLLRQLSLGALESDEAKAFLVSIPTVSELVPVVRLAEIEAALGEGNSPFRPERP